jgi:fumarylacetoacetase
MPKQSFLPVSPESDFPIQNLPYCIFSTPENSAPRGGVRIGEWIVDLSGLEKTGLLPTNYFSQPTLNSFMAAGADAWAQVREQLTDLLSEDTPVLRDDEALRERVLIPVEEVTHHLPASIGDYTDFYASREHATNVGTMFRGKENALMPNWLHLPVGYHGRASSIVPSGQDVIRPHGQILPKGADAPAFAASRQLDFELEMGFFIGPGNELGQPIPANETDKHIFGMVLLNDWSARDIQSWEYRPLGPFLGKNFASSISPYIVPMAALEPFRMAGPKQEPPPLDYLRTEDGWAYDVQLEVSLQSRQMDTPATICRSNLKYMYWSVNQQLAHHTVTGCNMRPGEARPPTAPVRCSSSVGAASARSNCPTVKRGHFWKTVTALRCTATARGMVIEWALGM